MWYFATIAQICECFAKVRKQFVKSLCECSFAHYFATSLTPCTNQLHDDLLHKQVIIH